ncbi:MAG: hypothetical protein OJJ21_12560 [Ferrovibrio sp.]|uniref:hypothetical protein n=1 Tax=Ferrovibrio sp. TaxID=1917215 RepID=UPI00262D64A3|nr:hypothetical protein [Ferrovibrio sp.]MCW0234423.1 hypothetical protein [Ferrovibrio sp.]
MTRTAARVAARKADPLIRGWRPRRLTLLPLILLLLSSCAGDPFADYAPLDGVIQHPYPYAPPQTARDGATLTAYDPARSFFPLALSGALVDYSRGPYSNPARGFTAALMADFNAVTADPEQPLAAQLAAADGARLLLLRARPDSWGELQHAALLDASETVVIAMARGTDGADAFARRVRQQAQGRRPVWALLPASARTGNGETLPDAAEARAMAFTAIVAGATGLIWLGEDNYAARNAGRLGIAPVPQMDYGIQAGSSIAPLKATPGDVAASRRLWDAVMQLNRRIARIVPALLQADAPDRYTVAVRMEDPPRPPVQLRSLLKAYDGGLLLIVVNGGEQPEDFRIGFSRAIRSLARLDDAETVQMDDARGLFRDRIAPRGVRIYRITLAG